MNPIGLVPVLEWDGHVLHESATCNDYLDAVYPGEKLNPSDPYKLARDRQLWESMNKVQENISPVNVTGCSFVFGTDSYHSIYFCLV